MKDELLYPKDISRDFLRELYDSAYMNVSLDDDGDVCLQENYTCWVFPQSDGRYIRLMSQFLASPGSLLPERHNFVNRINYDLKLVRAYVRENGNLGFDYTIVVEGGITRRNIVVATRLFLSLVDDVGHLDTDDVMG